MRSKRSATRISWDDLSMSARYFDAPSSSGRIYIGST